MESKLSWRRRKAQRKKIEKKIEKEKKKDQERLWRGELSLQAGKKESGRGLGSDSTEARARDGNE
jgi:hypothetical protein